MTPRCLAWVPEEAVVQPTEIEVNSLKSLYIFIRAFKLREILEREVCHSLMPEGQIEKNS